VTIDGSGRTKPDIVAPGVQVWSAFPNSTYSKLDGTSMAGPHITGVVALMWSANPDIIGDIDRTEQILIETATPFSGTLAGLDLELLMTQMFGEEMAQAVTGDVPEPEKPDVETGACISGTDLSQVPNNITGYGIVNAYEAVKRTLQNP
jgi:subtilisin family serine protease